MRLAAHQPQYLAWCGYFHKIAAADLFVIMDDVQYKKREFQNRNRIQDASGSIRWLTVPVINRGRYTQKIRDVEIDNSEDWRRIHLESLRHAYRRAPFFDWMFPDLQIFYSSFYQGLMELNVIQLRFFMERLGISTPLRFETEIGTRTTSTERLIEMCRACQADCYLSGAGGREYMDLRLFEESGISVEYQQFSHPVYPQWNLPFQPYLSVLDLLFHNGPDSGRILCSG